MIYSIRGKITAKGSDFLIVECGGIGYRCRTTLGTISQAGETGSEIMLYTHMLVKENAVELYGFSSFRELECFLLLISVSGVGPKAGISILSHMDTGQFAFCVASGDSKAFTKIKGVGAKTAQRIVLELKDKIALADGNLSGGVPQSGSTSAPQGSAVSEALEALLVLGYQQSEATKALSGLDSSLGVQELIKGALRAMSSSGRR